MQDKICIVGMGEIGQAVYRAIEEKQKGSKAQFELMGVDLPERYHELKEKGFTMASEVPYAHYYIICVWNAGQVADVIKKIKNKPVLISIESTIDPFRIQEIYDAAPAEWVDKIVFFPHRYNPNDPEHAVFNIKRVMGGWTQDALLAGSNLYEQFMDPNDILWADPLHACLSKVVENAYRFMEIVIAQELREAFNNSVVPVNFELLRRLCNTKWNINILEARDGVGGKCLPKDMNLLKNFVSRDLFNVMIGKNEDYKAKHGRNQEVSF